MVPQYVKETVLVPFFSSLASFSYDRARDLLEKEKECCKGVFSRWSHFIGTLVQLCTAEKQYMNLVFLQSRGFLRKDCSLKSLYESVGLEVDKLTDCNEASETEDVVSQLASDLAVLVKGRLTGMDFYERLSSSSSLPGYTELQTSIRSLCVKSKDVHSDSLRAWKEAFFLEIGLLYDCISMCVSLQNWDFYTSLTFLQSLTEKINVWTELVQNRETRSVRKLSFATSLLRGVSGQTDPLLFIWFNKFRAALLSKFSIYFYQVLAKQSSGPEMRALTSKLPVDQAARLTSFHRRADAAFICVVFDANGLTGYRGPGYYVPVVRKETCTPAGLELFPSIFFHPSYPSNHWPNIVMTLEDKDQELLENKPVYLYDAGIGTTYYLQMIEPRYTIVALFDGRRLERDSMINSFLQETAVQLRLTKVFYSLKPGSK